MSNTIQPVEGGGYINVATATTYDEDSRWNGSNHISVAIGSQWEHETLYRTTKGSFVLHRWSQFQGSEEHWLVIDDIAAHEWLLQNGHSQQLPEKALEAMEL